MGVSDQPGAGGSAGHEAEAAFSEWLRLRAAGGGGKVVDFSAFCAERPDLADRLRALHAQWLASQSFRQRLAERYGEGVDPDISLDAKSAGDAAAGAAATGDAGSGSDSAWTELIEQLSVHTPKSSRYTLEGEIARGGMGAIVKVWDEDLRRHLAMKVVLGKTAPEDQGGTPPVDDTLLGRFLEEAQVTGQLDHPGVVPVHELGIDAAGRVFFTMRLVKGRDLKAVFEQVRSGSEGWNQTRALNVLLKACDALAYAHSKGVVHRDLKPANIMVGRFGEVYVMDWGLACVIGRKDRKDIRLRPETETSAATLRTLRHDVGTETPDSPLVTMDGDVVGTPVYMSPEQARGEVEQIDARSDVYAMGAILYELLTGQMPYVPPGEKASNYMVLRWVREGPPKPVHVLASDVPAELEAICEKGMAREREHRYASVIELAEDLRAFLEGRVVKAYRTGAVVELRKWVGRNRPLAAACVAALLAIAIAIAYAVSEQLQRDLRARTELVNEQMRRGLGETTVVVGRRFMDDGNPLKSLAWFAKGLQLEAGSLEREWVHRLRLGMVMGASPKLQQLWIHPDLVNGIRFDRDGRRVATTCKDETIRIWDVSGGELVTSIPRPGDRIMLFPPDGNLVTVGNDGIVQAWDVETGQPVGEPMHHPDGVVRAMLTPDDELIVTGGMDGRVLGFDLSGGSSRAMATGHEGGVLAIAFSPDGRRLATGGNDRTARLWDAETGHPVAPPLQHDVETRFGSVVSVMFSPDGERLVTASHDGTAQVWDAATGELLLPPLEHTNGASSAMFSADGARIITSSSVAGVLRVWDASTGEPLTGWMEHDNQTYAPTPDPDERIMLVSCRDRAAHRWDLASGEEVDSPLMHAGPVIRSVFSPDGRQVVTASHDHTARLWDVGGPRLVVARVGHEDAVLHAAFDPSGRRLVTASRDGTARVWDAATGAPISPPLKHAAPVRDAAFDRDGARVVTASDDGWARVWDAMTGEQLRAPMIHEAGVRRASFSPDGAFIATASRDDTARIWAAAAGGSEVARMTHTETVIAAVFSHDGRFLLTASWDHTARVWDARTGEPVSPPLEHRNQILHADFSPDGRLVVTTSEDFTARVWDASTGRPAGPPLQHNSGVYHAAFSPDGTRVATGGQGRLARIWDWSTGEFVTVPMGHKHWIRRVAFSPDGRLLATASADGTARVWDAATGQPVSPTLAHGPDVMSVSFSPDASRLLTASEAGNATVWALPVADGSVERLVATAELLAGHRTEGFSELVPLTPDEIDERWRTVRQ